MFIFLDNLKFPGKIPNSEGGGEKFLPTSFFLPFSGPLASAVTSLIWNLDQDLAITVDGVRCRFHIVLLLQPPPLLRK